MKNMFNENLKSARNNKKLTQEQLAESIDIGSQHIGHLESGTKKPSLKTLKKLSLCLDIPIDDLLFGNSFNKWLNELEPLLKKLSKKEKNEILSICKILYKNEKTPE